MAELALTALAKLGLSAAAGAGAAGAGVAAAGAGAAAATGSATLLSTLQGVATTVSILGTIGQTLSAFNASNAQADQAELEAGQSQLESVQRQTSMKRELLRVMGENDTRFAAAGIDLTGGIAANSRAKNKRRAAQEISIERDNSDFQSALYRARATGLRRKATSQLFAGAIESVGQGVNYGINRIRLGV